MAGCSWPWVITWTYHVLVDGSLLTLISYVHWVFPAKIYKVMIMRKPKDQKLLRISRCGHLTLFFYGCSVGVWHCKRRGSKFSWTCLYRIIFPKSFHWVGKPLANIQIFKDNRKMAPKGFFALTLSVSCRSVDEEDTPIVISADSKKAEPFPDSLCSTVASHSWDPSASVITALAQTAIMCSGS